MIKKLTYCFNEYVYSINHERKTRISRTIMTTLQEATSDEWLERGVEDLRRQLEEVGLLATITRRVEREEGWRSEWLEWTEDEAREYWEADQMNEESIVIEEHSASEQIMKEWLEWLEETRDEPREYWLPEQMSEETTEECMERRRVWEVTRREWEEMREAAMAARQADAVVDRQDTRWAWRWDAVHQEMLGWGDGEYEPNGYPPIPAIPSGILLATVIWTQAWEDIIKHIPVTMNHLASYEQFHTIPEEVNITEPMVIGVRV